MYIENYLTFILSAFGFVGLIIGIAFVYLFIYNNYDLDDVYQSIIAVSVGFVILVVILYAITAYIPHHTVTIGNQTFNVTPDIPGNNNNNGGIIDIITPPVVSPFMAIQNIAINMTKKNNSLYDVRFYWEVKNGIGCCNTFGCYKDQFFAQCIYPNFKLFDIERDGVMFDWRSIDTSQWNYTCDFRTPWNYFTFYDVPAGHHNFTIYQKDCQQIIDIQEMQVEVK